MADKEDKRPHIMTKIVAIDNEKVIAFVDKAAELIKDDTLEVEIRNIKVRLKSPQSNHFKICREFYENVLGKSIAEMITEALEHGIVSLHEHVKSSIDNMGTDGQSFKGFLKEFADSGKLGNLMGEFKEYLNNKKESSDDGVPDVKIDDVDTIVNDLKKAMEDGNDKKD